MSAEPEVPARARCPSAGAADPERFASRVLAVLPDGATTVRRAAHLAQVSNGDALLGVRVLERRGWVTLEERSDWGKGLMTLTPAGREAARRPPTNGTGGEPS
jgi:hypothetical protein